MPIDLHEQVKGINLKSLYFNLIVHQISGQAKGITYYSVMIEGKGWQAIDQEDLSRPCV